MSGNLAKHRLDIYLRYKWLVPPDWVCLPSSTPSRLPVRHHREHRSLPRTIDKIGFRSTGTARYMRPRLRRDRWVFLARCFPLLLLRDSKRARSRNPTLRSKKSANGRLFRPRDGCRNETPASPKRSKFQNYRLAPGVPTRWSTLGNVANDEVHDDPKPRRCCWSSREAHETVRDRRRRMLDGWTTEWSGL